MRDLLDMIVAGEAAPVRLVLPCGTRVRLEDGPSGLTDELVLVSDVEVEFVARGTEYTIYEVQSEEWLYVRTE